VKDNSKKLNYTGSTSSFKTHSTLFNIERLKLKIDFSSEFHPERESGEKPGCSL
jgi:hypothetical protein